MQNMSLSLEAKARRLLEFIERTIQKARDQMRYETGDKVILAEQEFKNVYTVAKADGNDSQFPYMIKDYKGHVINGWYAEDDLKPAGNLVDSEEATETFMKRLESGYFDKKDEGLSEEEIHGLLKALDNDELTGKVHDMLSRKPEEGQSEAEDEDEDIQIDIPDIDVESDNKDFVSTLISTLEIRFNENYEDGAEDGYKDGLRDAWELVRKLTLQAEYPDIAENLDEIFGENAMTPEKVFARYSPKEALDKVWAYEREREIAVGDEVYTSVDKDGDFTNKGIVLWIDHAGTEPGSIGVMSKDGHMYGGLKIKDCYKTGKYYDMQAILDGLKED